MKSQVQKSIFYFSQPSPQILFFDAVYTITVLIYYSTSQSSTGREIFPEWCKSQGLNVIEIFSREQLDSLDFQKRDLLISDRTSFIFEKEWLSSNTLLKVNVHPSLLPRHRGSFPIFWSALLGSKWGVTLHKIEEGIDDGPIVDQVEISYDDTCSFRDLYEKYRSVTQIILEEMVIKFAKGYNFEGTPQPKITFNPHTVKKSKKLFEKLSAGWDTRIVDARSQLEKEIYIFMQENTQT